LANSILSETINEAFSHNLGQKRTSSIIKTLVSSQQWKLWICACAVAFVGVCQFAPAWVVALIGIDVTSVMLLGLAGACLILLVASLAIRCPACGLSLVWSGILRQRVSEWLSWLLGVEICPRCGFSHHPADREK
jgi:hypothetical protein